MWVLRSVELLPNVGCREGGRIVQTSTHPHALTLSPLLRVYPSLQLPADEVKQLVVSMGGRGCSTMYSTSGRWIEGLSLLARHELIAIRLPAPLFVPQEHQLRSQPTYAPWHRGMAGKRAGLRPSTGNGQDQVRGGRNRGRVGSAAYPSPPPGWAASAAVAACPSPPPPCAPGVCVGGGGGGGVWVGGGGGGGGGAGTWGLPAGGTARCHLSPASCLATHAPLLQLPSHVQASSGTGVYVPRG